MGQERQRKLAEDQRNLLQQQAQAKAQNLRYEDELARKRLQVRRKTVNLCLTVLKIVPLMRESLTWNLCRRIMKLRDGIMLN